VIRKSFHPDYEDMVPIIEEVTAGLLAFCATLGVPTRAAALGVSSGASRQTDQTATVTG
jgi:predicted O-methyltransferase YrrM